MAKKPTGRTKTRPVFSPGTFIQRSRAERPEQKAIWQQVTGAGKSRVRRPFLGVTAPEQTTLRDTLAQQIDRRLRSLNA